ncbi:membrane protein insertion efficiency factor YidD [Aerococcus urinaeequi]|uniref:membrane protein insertion efficiency factor YidD n=1 Tax=Aerococcus urinaeequi TaxID=51665 RepID=UPI00366E70BC
MNSILLASIKDYQKGISPLLPPSCCEYPTCSHYAVEGVGKHEATKGSLMQAGRILR